MAKLWQRRRLVLSLTLCLVVILFATVAVRTFVRPPTPTQSTPRASAATATPAVHSTFLFNFDGFANDVHVGQQVSLRWWPTPMPRKSPADAAVGPLTVVCTLDLYGPYRSASAALLSNPPRKQAFSAPPLSLTDWESEPQQVD